MLSSRRETLARLALASAATLFALGIMEVYLRLDDRRPPMELFRVELSGHPYSFRESPDRLRDLGHAVVFLGDSFTQGAACPREEAYPGALERLAQARGLDLEARNLGIGGTGPFHYAGLAEDLLATGARPLAVVVTLFENDIELDCGACRYEPELDASGELLDSDREELAQRCAACRAPQARAQDERLLLGLHEASYVWRLLRRAAAGFAVAMRWDFEGMARRDKKWADPAGLPRRLMRFAVARTGEQLRSAGIPSLVLLYPGVVSLRPDAPFVELYRRAAEDLSSASGLAVRSGHPAFLGRPNVREDMTYSLTDGHPSCEAHAMFAAFALAELGPLLALRSAPPAASRVAPP